MSAIIQFLLMNLKYIILFSAIISFFQSLTGQNKRLKDVDVFRKNPSEVASFDEAKKEAEKIV